MVTHAQRNDKRECGNCLNPGPPHGAAPNRGKISQQNCASLLYECASSFAGVLTGEISCGFGHWQLRLRVR